MLLSAVSVLVVAQSISEIPDGFMNNPVFTLYFKIHHHVSYGICYGTILQLVENHFICLTTTMKP
jgi:hypothetical protein